MRQGDPIVRVWIAGAAIGAGPSPVRALVVAQPRHDFRDPRVIGGGGLPPRVRPAPIRGQSSESESTISSSTTRTGDPGSDRR